MVDDRVQARPARRPRRRTSRRGRRCRRAGCRNHPSSRTNRSTPDRRRRVGQRLQPVEVVVEVDRLPGVEHERAAGCVGGWAAARAGCGAAGRDRPSRPSRGPDEDARRAPRRSPPAPSRTSPGSQQLAAAEDGGVRRRRPRAAARPGARGRRSTRRGPPRPRRCGSRSRACPAVSSRVASWPVRPRREARRWVPSEQAERCGDRSRHQRPVRSRTSVARGGSGSSARRAPTS